MTEATRYSEGSLRQPTTWICRRAQSRIRWSSSGLSTAGPDDPRTWSTSLHRDLSVRVFGDRLPPFTIGETDQEVPARS